MRMPLACSITARRPKLPAACGSREAIECDVDRALQLFGGGVDDLGEDAALGRLAHEGGVACGEQCDHWAEASWTISPIRSRACSEGRAFGLSLTLKPAGRCASWGVRFSKRGQVSALRGSQLLA